MAVNGIEIKVGQVWRCRDGELRKVTARDAGTGMNMPWLIEDLWYENDGGCPGVKRSALDELIEDENGFTVWRGGEQPEETRGKRVEWLSRRMGKAPIDSPADNLDWSHDDNGGDIMAYKVIGERDAKSDPPIGIDPGESGGDRCFIQVEISPGYEKLFDVLMAALRQASGGKGKERHARDGVAFQDQPMSQINKQLGSIDGFIYQAHKKSLETKRLPDGRAQAELLGAINYLAGAVIALDTWAKKVE